MDRAFTQLQPLSASSPPASQQHRAARPDGPRPSAAHRGPRHAPPATPAAKEAAAEWPGCYKGWKRTELLQGPLDDVKSLKKLRIMRLGSCLYRVCTYIARVSVRCLIVDRNFGPISKLGKVSNSNF